MRYTQYLTCVWVALVAMVVVGGCKRGHRSDRSALLHASSYGGLWDDPLRCHEMVSKGRRLKRADDRFRLVTWNVRWFPDGVPGEAPRVSRTDVGWAACVIAYLDPALLLLQEIKLTSRGTSALAELTEKLQEYTGATWRWEADACPKPSTQHLLFLYRTDRVALTESGSHGEIDPTGTPDGAPTCPGRLRPALGAYVKSLQGGVDFHLVNAHLDSGRKTSDFENRQQAWTLIDSVFTRRLSGTMDDDLIWGGDFNLMGCEGCPVEDGESEIEHMAAAVAALPRPLRLLTPQPACSEYYKGQPGVLDTFAISTAMEEAADVQVVASGICGASSCSPVASEQLPFFMRLSDHCPIVLDLLDRDMDGVVAAEPLP